ncbi:N-lysine methyltransferase SETD6 [Lamellibrachia satsuma]|nr:N-lysine methyltransferase SETD6 [Lamellibrachia satsuma]
MERNTSSRGVKRSAASLTESDEDRIETFLDWCRREGLGVSDKVTIGRDGSCAQFGMVATADIAEGEHLFEIPQHLLLTPDTSAIAQLLHKERDCIKSRSGWVPLLLALMYEYTNPTSRWRPYTRLLPDFDELDLPMFWPKSEVDQQLTGTGVVEAVTKDLTSLTEEFQTLVLPFIKKHANIFPSECQSLEFYKKMVAFVMAYSFTEPCDDEDNDDDINQQVSPPVMVPMADVLNHIAKNNAHLNFGKEVLTMVAKVPICRGEEIFNTYGELANFQLLHMYGFAESYPHNHYDTVEIAMKLVGEVVKRDAAVLGLEAVEEKWKFLCKQCLKTERGCWGVEGILTEDETYHTLKVLAMNKEKFKEYIENDGWSEAESEKDNSTCESLTNDDVQNLPPVWKQLLKRITECRLQQYSQKLDVDHSLVLPSSFTSNRHKYATYVIYGQKKLLYNLIQMCT